MIECVDHKGESVSVHKEKFRFRPSVYGVIRNGNRICVCKNKSSGKFWFPGGGIEIGEKIHDALLREIEEEVGLKNVRIGRQLGVMENFFYYGPKDEAMHAFLFFYECVTDDTNLKSNEDILDDEAMDFRWVNPEEINEDHFTDLKGEIMTMLKMLKE